MNTILSSYTASVSDLKRNPTRLLEEAGGEPVAILNHNKPSAYLVPPELYESMLERLDDLELAALVKSREPEKKKALAVSIDEL